MATLAITVKIEDGDHHVEEEMLIKLPIRDPAAFVCGADQYFCGQFEPTLQAALDRLIEAKTAANAAIRAAAVKEEKPDETPEAPTATET